MSVIINREFETCPSFEDCSKVIFPVNFEIGTIFIKGQGTALSRLLYRIKKIEALKDHPDHLIVSSVIIGSVVLNNIYEKTKTSFLEIKE